MSVWVSFEEWGLLFRQSWVVDYTKTCRAASDAKRKGSGALPATRACICIDADL